MQRLRRGNLIPKTLVLNADYNPISVTSANRSIMLCRANKALALEESDQLLRSENESIPCPSVIVLSRYVKVNRLISRTVRDTASRYEIMARDNWECQYCGSAATTIDHIVPISKGGPSTWKNLVAACWSCNNKKGSKPLTETGMTLRRPAEAPSPWENWKIRSQPDCNHRHAWRKYLMPES